MHKTPAIVISKGPRRAERCQPSGGKVRRRVQPSSHERALAHSTPRNFIVFVLRRTQSAAALAADVHSWEEKGSWEREKMEEEKKTKREGGGGMSLVTGKVQKYWPVRDPVGQKTAIFPQIERLFLY